MGKLENEYQNDGLYTGASKFALSRQSRARHDRVVSWIATALGIISLAFLATRWFNITIPSFSLRSCHKHASDQGGVLLPDKEGLSLMGDFLEPAIPEKPRSQGVPLEAHIMSKCPDARDCLQKLVIPAMEQVSDKVDFELSFIASVSNRSSDVHCMHGPTECIGDMLMLCAANLPFPPESEIPQSDGSRTPTIRSLGFANCLIDSYPNIPDRSLVEDCAWKHGINFDALNECVSKQEDDPTNDIGDWTPLSGLALLRKSARHSDELGIQTSCTLRLDDSIWCVRDSGVWKDCAEEGQGSEVSVLVREIHRLWRERN